MIPWHAKFSLDIMTCWTKRWIHLSKAHHIAIESITLYGFLSGHRYDDQASVFVTSVVVDRVSVDIYVNKVNNLGTSCLST